MAVVASALIFQSIFGTQYGVINTILDTTIPWLQDPNLTKIIVVVLMIWRGMGWWFVIYLAGLTSINPEVEEAAIVDGATPLQRLFWIIIPLMRNVFLFAFVIDAVTSFRLFAEPNVLVARGGSLAPNDVAPVLNLLLMNLQNGQFGLSAASGWIIFVLIASVTVIQFAIMRTREEVAE
jgi:ABC-type sugar transport system permease subunit